MTIYLDRLARVCPPRGDAANAGSPRALACNASTASVELDTDIFQIPLSAGATGVAAPGTFGRALVELYADGNDLYLNFGQASSVAANSASMSGNTQAACIAKGTYARWELDPLVDKWMSARTLNGGGVTATLRYRIVSFPTRSSPA